jgi:nucleoside-diphosphate-sugar epimerase
MRVLVAGGTGVVGSQVVPLLTRDRHDVVVVGRSRARADAAVGLGAEFAEADALDAGAVRAAVEASQPDAIVNLLTAIPRNLNAKRFEEEMALTNRLRNEGTRNLIEAGKAVGVSRLVSESIAFAYAPAPGLADEEASLWHDGPKPFRAVLAAVEELERLTVAASGIVLRVGHLYGPGTALAADGALLAQVRAAKLPVVGDGGSMFSFAHVRDAAGAFVAALSHDGPAVFNVVDDEPAPVRLWLPQLAELIGAPRPKKVATAIARLFAGEWGVAYLTSLRGASNRRAREQLGWQPTYASWRDGFAAELGASVSAPPPAREQAR